MRRRDLIKGIAASTTWPLVAHAQQPAMKRVGIVTIQPRTSPPYVAFDQRLRELGHVEGQNLSLDFINPERQPGGNAGAVQELIRRKVDIILAVYQPTIAAIVAAAPGMPIVMIAIDYDPLAFGYVKSLARPGGDVTGLYLQQLDLAKKRVELLTQALPNLHAATVFWDSASEDQWKATSSARAGVRSAACRCAIA
jgi:putative tryptophan/tyrosine transport system substrate-binding protein